MKLEGEAGRDVIRYIKQEGAPSIELCPRERLVSEATGQVDACERACAPAYRNSPLERVPYRSGDAPIKSRKPHSTRFACYDRPFQGQFPSRKFLHLNWSLREWENWCEEMEKIEKRVERRKFKEWIFVEFTWKHDSVASCESWNISIHLASQRSSSDLDLNWKPNCFPEISSSESINISVETPRLNQLRLCK